MSAFGPDGWKSFTRGSRPHLDRSEPAKKIESDKVARIRGCVSKLGEVP